MGAEAEAAPGPAVGHGPDNWGAAAAPAPGPAKEDALSRTSWHPSGLIPLGGLLLYRSPGCFRPGCWRSKRLIWKQATARSESLWRRLDALEAELQMSNSSGSQASNSSGRARHCRGAMYN
jgi:hypothetical protein